MGKGFENYMSKKWFHPTNIDNQKRVYEATQKKAAELKRQQDLRDQYEREQEIFSSKQLMGDEKARLGLAFMYNAPGSLKDQKSDQKEDNRLDSVKAEPTRNVERTKNVRCLKCKRFGHANTDKACPLYGKSRLDDENAELFDEVDRKTALAESAKKPEIKNEPAEYEDMIKGVKLEEAEAVEVTLDMLRTLSKKEKKAILKRLLRLEKKNFKK